MPGWGMSGLWWSKGVKVTLKVRPMYFGVLKLGLASNYLIGKPNLENCVTAGKHNNGQKV